MELVGALLAVALLGQTRLVSYAARVGFVAGLGILAALPTKVAYWNWYGFPGNYTLAHMTSQIVGFLVVGLVAAAVLRRSAQGAAAQGDLGLASPAVPVSLSGT